MAEPPEGTQWCKQCEKWRDPSAFLKPNSTRQCKTCETCRGYHRKYAQDKKAAAPEGTKYCGGGCGKHVPIAGFTDDTGRVRSRCNVCRARVEEKKTEVRDDGTKYCGICNAYRPIADFSGLDADRTYESCAKCRGYQKTYKEANKDKIKKRQVKKPKTEEAVQTEEAGKEAPEEETSGVDTKKCTYCKKRKPLEAFAGSKEGEIMARCQSCREYLKDWKKAQKNTKEEGTKCCAGCYRHLPVATFPAKRNGIPYSRCQDCRQG